jgi:hypothetical protein
MASSVDPEDPATTPNNLVDALVDSTSKEVSSETKEDTEIETNHEHKNDDKDEEEENPQAENKMKRKSELRLNVEGLVKERKELKRRLAEVEIQLSSAVQALQAEDEEISSVLPPPPGGASPPATSDNHGSLRMMDSSLKGGHSTSSFAKRVTIKDTEGMGPHDEPKHQPPPSGVNRHMSESYDGVTDLELGIVGEIDSSTGLIVSNATRTNSLSNSSYVFEEEDEIDEVTAAEIDDVIAKTTSKHTRTEEEAHHKIVTVRKDPALLEEPHEETFFELFYDLILVVVFIDLGYLKYNMTASGLLTVAVIFSNFWSCWSLMNCYATMLHTEDMLHRVYYVAHITTSFIMAITIQHPSHDFFNYSAMVNIKIIHVIYLFVPFNTQSFP